MAGWGRRKAPGATGSRLEEDELFKSIGGQLEAHNFDYSQWQRSGKRPTPSQKLPPVRRPDSRQESSQIDVFTVGTRPKKPARHGSACSSSCRHPFIKHEVLIDDTEGRKRAERMRLLQLRINTRQQTLEQCRSRYRELIKQNVQLKEEIQGKEDSSHDGVKQLLKKYERFRGGVAVLNEKFSKEYLDAHTDLEDTKFRLENELKALESDVNTLNSKVKEQQEQLHILKNYKDEEYPVKALKISELQREIEQLKVSHEEDHTDLQHIVDTEIEKFKRETNKLRKNTTEEVAEMAMKKMHPSLKDMAIQNIVMVKEIQFHEEELCEMETVIKELEKEVRLLVKNPSSNLRLQVFPEFFPVREKCTPDMDIILNIPRQEWLPV